MAKKKAVGETVQMNFNPEIKVEEGKNYLILTADIDPQPSGITPHQNVEMADGRRGYAVLDEKGNQEWIYYPQGKVGDVVSVTVGGEDKSAKILSIQVSEKVNDAERRRTFCWTAMLELVSE